MLEVQPLDLPEVVAVDLVRKRIGAFDDELVEVDLLVEVVRLLDAAAAEGTGERAQDRRCLHRPERHRDEAAVQGRGWRQIERPVPEVRVRVGVEHDREEAVVDHTGRRPHAEVRLGAVVAAQPGGQCRGDEQRVAEPALQRRPPFDGGDDRGIEADPGVEAEEAPVDPTQTDRPQVAGVDAASEEVDGGNRIVGQPDRAGEHVGRPSGQHAESGVGAGDARRHLVQRAVAAEPDDDVDVAPSGVEGEPGGVPATVRLDQLDLVVAGKAALHDDRVARRDGRRERVDDEQDPQASPG